MYCYEKKIRVLLMGLAIIGLFSLGNTSFADAPLCSGFTGFHTDNYEQYPGGYCKCAGEYAIGWAKYCRYDPDFGYCDEMRCNGLPCCYEDTP